MSEDIHQPWLFGWLIALCIVSLPLIVAAICLYWWFIA